MAKRKVYEQKNLLIMVGINVPMATPMLSLLNRENKRILLNEYSRFIDTLLTAERNFLVELFDDSDTDYNTLYTKHLSLYQDAVKKVKELKVKHFFYQPLLFQRCLWNRLKYQTDTSS